MTDRMRYEQPSHHNDEDSQKEDPATQGFELISTFSRHYNGQSNIATLVLRPREKQLKYKKTPISALSFQTCAISRNSPAHTDKEKSGDTRHCEKRRE
jgi:hypothetical protein